MNYREKYRELIDKYNDARNKSDKDKTLKELLELFKSELIKSESESPRNNCEPTINILQERAAVFEHIKKYRKAFLDLTKFKNRIIKTNGGKEHPHLYACYYSMGLYLMKLGRKRYKCYFQKSIDLFEKDKDFDLERNLSGIAFMLKKIGNFDKALEYLYKDLKGDIGLQPSSTVLKKQIQVCSDIGVIYCKKEDYINALKYFIMALEYFNKALKNFNKSPEYSEIIDSQLMFKSVRGFVFSLKQEDIFTTKSGKNLNLYRTFKPLIDTLLFTDDVFKEATKNCSNEQHNNINKEVYILCAEIMSLLHVEFKPENHIERDIKGVAHYTRQDTVEHILFDNPKSIWRLNTIVTANDPSEGQTLIEYLGLNDINNDDHQNDYEAFMSCFTFNHDHLTQFRLYGKQDNKEGTGLSVILRSSFFCPTPQDLSIYQVKVPGGPTFNDEVKSDTKPLYSLYHCVYLDPVTSQVVSLGHREEYTFYRQAIEKYNKLQKTMQSPKLKANYIKEAKRNAKSYQDRYQKNLSLVKFKFQKLKKLINLNPDSKLNNLLLVNLRYLIKNVAFKEEQECRIIDVLNIRNNDLVKVDQGMYIEYQPAFSYIDKIYFGPKANGLRLFKDKAKNKDHDIMCIQSELPLT